MLESKLKYNRTETKTAMVAKMVEFIKTCDQYPYKFNFCHFFSSIILLPFCWGKYKKRCLGEMVNFLLPRQEVMIRTWGKFLLRDRSKNAQIQLFDSHMHFPVILTPWIWNFFATVVRNTGLKKFKKHSGENINPLGVHRNMRGCILKVNSEGLGW